MSNNDQNRYQSHSKETIDNWMQEHNMPAQFLDANFPYNIMALGLNNKPLFDHYLTMGGHVNSKASISAANRELLILRCAVKIDSDYEWHHHEHIARDAGVGEKTLAALKEQSPQNLSDVDQLLVKACDELLDHTQISDETFAALSERFSTAEILEIIAVVGIYNWTAMMLKSFKVPVEAMFKNK